MAESNTLRAIVGRTEQQQYYELLREGRINQQTSPVNFLSNTLHDLQSTLEGAVRRDSEAAK
jgi:hypothetical protein